MFVMVSTYIIVFSMFLNLIYTGQLVSPLYSLEKLHGILYSFHYIFFIRKSGGCSLHGLKLFQFYVNYNLHDYSKFMVSANHLSLNRDSVLLNWNTSKTIWENNIKYEGENYTLFLNYIWLFATSERNVNAS